MTHTPGTWVVTGQHCQDHPLGIRAGPACVAAICDQGVSDTNLAQMEANARLIAAAPDLLAALREIADICSGPAATRTELAFAVAESAHGAIARATGGTP